MDIFTKEKRSEVMSHIKGKDTKPEIKVRSYLHRNGIRFRKQCSDIKGSPDICIRKYKIAVFVNGCFWHGHENCALYKPPKSNKKFWHDKIDRNIKRDQETYSYLNAQGWHVIVIWECEINKSLENRMHDVVTIIRNLQKDNNE